jgi:hypothetical protein
MKWKKKSEEQREDSGAQGRPSRRLLQVLFRASFQPQLQLLLPFSFSASVLVSFLP